MQFKSKRSESQQEWRNTIKGMLNKLDENTVSQAFSKERMKMIKSILGGANN
jgi:hypothetical protein